jgi:hypothetical protein
VRVADSRALQLLATVLDGADMGEGRRVEERRCRLCKNWMVRFTAAAGLQAKVGVAADAVVCVSTDGGLLGMPCLGALEAKPLLEALKKGSRVRP